MAYTVTVQPSGRSFQAGAGQALLAEGLAQGLALPYSCKSGICRTCKGRVLSGHVSSGNDAVLTPEEREQGVVLLCRAEAMSDCAIEVQEAPRSFEPKNLPARVAAIKQITADVAIVSLALPMNQKLLMMPGQYIDVLLPGETRRSYSVANVPGPEGVREIELHIRRVPGGSFTTHVFEKMKARDMLRFEGPFGSFYLRENSGPIVMLASGTGFAPVKAMIESMLGQPGGLARRVDLYWGGRRRADLYCADLARSWTQASPLLRFIPVLSDPSAACGWSGRTGLVHRAVMEDHPDLGGFDVYACGAPAMVDAARRDFVERCALPERNFFADSFLTQADRLAPAAR